MNLQYNCMTKESPNVKSVFTHYKTSHVTEVKFGDRVRHYWVSME